MKKQIKTIVITLLVAGAIGFVAWYAYQDRTPKEVQPTVQDVPPPMQQVIPLTDTTMVMLTWEDQDHNLKRDAGRYIRHGVGHQVGNRYVYDSIMREEVQAPVYNGTDTNYKTISNSKVLNVNRLLSCYVKPTRNEYKKISLFLYSIFNNYSGMCCVSRNIPIKTNEI